MTLHLPGDAALIKLAGKAAFERGRGYYRDRRVVLSKVSPTALAAVAQGTQRYTLSMKFADGDWQWCCSCPAADAGALCKHLVAAILTARDEANESDAVSARSTSRAKSDDLFAFLRAQPAERLAGWLQALADEDGDIEKRLLLYRAAEQPGALKAALAKVLNTGGFLDYRRAMTYAKRLQAVIGQLNELLLRDAEGCRVLCEYALGRLFKIYENSDDSAGAMGDCIGTIVQLHARACAAAPPGKVLAKSLRTLMAKDGWSMLHLADYWKALGAQGQSAYSKLVVADFEQLPAPKPDEHYGDAFKICRLTEELARCAGDFDLLQRVLRRDLQHDYQHLRVLESLREFGRTREALAWAELAVKRFPRDGRLRQLLAECLLDSGMDEEALEQTWQRFQQQPNDAGWDALKRIADKAWPVWRQRALDEVAAREKDDVTVRVILLLHDGDVRATQALACDRPLAVHLLDKLARRLRRSDPVAAGQFYLRLARYRFDHLRSASDYSKLVAPLKEASLLLPTEAWQPLADTIRTGHARKPKLMGLLTNAGL